MGYQHKDSDKSRSLSTDMLKNKTQRDNQSFGAKTQAKRSNIEMDQYEIQEGRYVGHNILPPK